MKKLTRRQFLASAGATSAALMLSGLPHAAAAEENCLKGFNPCCYQLQQPDLGYG